MSKVPEIVKPEVIVQTTNKEGNLPEPLQNNVDMVSAVASAMQELFHDANSRDAVCTKLALYAEFKTPSGSYCSTIVVNKKGEDGKPVELPPPSESLLETFLNAVQG